MNLPHPQDEGAVSAKNAQPDQASPTPPRSRFWSILNEKEHRQHYVFICVLLWSILSFLLISHYVLGAVQVQGRSMESTLHDGDRHVVNRLVYHFRDPHRGELVVLNDHLDDSLCVKRIVGMPGELIEFRRGKVYLNGDAFPETYLDNYTFTLPLVYGEKPIQIPPGHYFVLGDNREDSVDSRVYGPLQRKDILGVISR